MQHGGEEGRKNVGLWTRWLTVILAHLQATAMVIALNRAHVFLRTDAFYLVMVVITLTAGTVWLMWLGEQITDKGIGNGVSLIIFVGIILRYPTYFSQTLPLGEKGGLNVSGLRRSLSLIAVHLADLDHLHVPRSAPRTGPIRQTRGWPQSLRRPKHLHPAAPEQRGRHLDHLRDLDPAPSAADLFLGRAGTACRWMHGPSCMTLVFQLRQRALQRRHTLSCGRRVHVLL